MTNFLLFCVLIAQLITIAVLLYQVNHSTTDFSKEDREVKEAQKEINEARNLFPPQT